MLGLNSQRKVKETSDFITRCYNLKFISTVSTILCQMLLKLKLFDLIVIITGLGSSLFHEEYRALP